jgi:hypothetical protein
MHQYAYGVELKARILEMEGYHPEAALTGSKRR